MYDPMKTRMVCEECMKVKSVCGVFWFVIPVIEHCGTYEIEKDL